MAKNYTLQKHGGKNGNGFNERETWYKAQNKQRGYKNIGIETQIFHSPLWGFYIVEYPEEHIKEYLNKKEQKRTKTNTIKLMKELKWVTISTYIDQETGEVLNKKRIEKDYYITKKIKEQNETLGIVKYTIKCRKRAQQLKLKF